MRGLAAGSGSLWDSDLVTGVAFHPRKCSPKPKSDYWFDGDIQARDGVRLAYRLYTPPQTSRYHTTDGKVCVLVYFHANAELCTDLEADVDQFYECGFRAVLCPEFRGFAWSTGKPSLRQLCPDSEEVVEAIPQILSKAGVEVEEAQIVAHGRSLGTICAVHLAATYSSRISGLIIESGVIDLLKLPMVKQLGAMMPQMLQVLMREPLPVHTLEEMHQVTVPTLIIHGDRDEMSPVDQAIQAHKACASSAKKLVRYARGGHNDLRILAKSEYYRELQNLCHILSSDCDPVEAFMHDEPAETGFFAMLTGALRCFPGVRRCFVGSIDDASVTSPR